MKLFFPIQHCMLILSKVNKYYLWVPLASCVVFRTLSFRPAQPVKKRDMIMDWCMWDAASFVTHYAFTSIGNFLFKAFFVTVMAVLF